MLTMKRKRRRSCPGLWWGLGASLAAGCLIRRILKREEEDLVFITEVGTRYHRPDCVHLQASKKALPRSEAIAEGYQACGVCQP